MRDLIDTEAPLKQRPFLRRAAFALPLLAAACTTGSGLARTATGGLLAPCPGTDAPLSAGAPCGLVCRAELPIVPSVSGQALVDVTVDDPPARLVVDTGASITVLRGESQAGLRFGLPIPRAGFTMAVNGPTKAASVTVRSIAFGHVRLTDMPADVVAGYSVLGPDFSDGLLGADILSRYQLDLDIPHGTIRLYQGRLCPGPLPGWTQEDGTAPFATSLPVVAARLGGTPALAYLDTGSTGPLMDTALAHAAGVGDAALAADRTRPFHGVGPGTLTASRHRFATLTVGPETVADVDIDVARVPLPSGTMLIGEDFFRAHRVWIDYAARLVHFAGPR